MHLRVNSNKFTFQHISLPLSKTRKTHHVCWWLNYNRTFFWLQTHFNAQVQNTYIKNETKITKESLELTYWNKKRPSSIQYRSTISSPIIASWHAQILHHHQQMHKGHKHKAPLTNEDTKILHHNEYLQLRPRPISTQAKITTLIVSTTLNYTHNRLLPASSSPINETNHSTRILELTT